MNDRPMIQFNTPYDIDRGKNSIVFAQGEGGVVTGRYEGGELLVRGEGGHFSGTFDNHKVGVTGLIEIQFHPHGFHARWKKGTEPGPMRGSWVGELQVPDLAAVLPAAEAEVPREPSLLPPEGPVGLWAGLLQWLRAWR